MSIEYTPIFGIGVEVENDGMDESEFYFGDYLDGLLTGTDYLYFNVGGEFTDEDEGFLVFLGRKYNQEKFHEAPEKLKELVDFLEKSDYIKIVSKPGVVGGLNAD